MNQTQQPDPRPGNYYVSIVRNAGSPGQRLGLLAGPFPQHQTALDLVDRARGLAENVDPWAAFDAFGTVRMADDYTQPGVLNAQLL
jgi:hypothetical protein